MTKEQTFEHPPRGHVALLAYDSVNDRFQVVHVDASGLLQVDVAAVADPQANAHGYDGAAWRKQPLIWSYSDRLVDQKQNADTPAGAVTLSHTTVPAGEVWTVLGGSVVNVNTATPCRMWAALAGLGIAVYEYGTLAISVYSITSPLNIVLKAGDNVDVTFSGCTLGDTILSNIFGYKMSIAL